MFKWKENFENNLKKFAIVEIVGKDELPVAECDSKHYAALITAGLNSMLYKNRLQKDS